MLFQVLVFVTFAILLGAVAWWNWSQRQLAMRQAEMQRELARLGQGVSEVAHDLQNLLAAISVNVLVARDLPDGERDEALDDVERATWSASRMVANLRPRYAATADGIPIGTLVQLHAALMRRMGIPIDVKVEGSLSYDGGDAVAERVIVNLLSNAVREARHQDGGFVRIHLTDACLTVSNPVRDPSKLGPEIWERSVSREGSTGLGLAIVRDAADEAGWSVRHELEGGVVHFVVAEGERRSRVQVAS